MKDLAKELFGYIDLTTLNATDNVQSVTQLVDYALACEKNGLRVAALCVFPNFGELVLSELKGSAIHTAVVAGSFPHGQSFLSIKIEEVRLAAKLGVHDIDVVLNRGHFFEGNHDAVIEEIRALKLAAGKAKLKVILETGELVQPQHIRKAAQLALTAGADFIKTSTGKCEIGATEEAAQIMCEEIKHHFERTGMRVGFKSSGGIRNFEQAATYRDIVFTVLGEEWLTPELFRIGASSLAKELEQLITNE
jgi:deoxyribose-phosphate aldolase